MASPSPLKQLPPAIFLMGPTASGKTGVAVELIQRLPVEIISVDSALVYRHMDIGTAKPDAATLAAAPHHLIDVISPTQSYSAAQFRSDALRLMADITARGKIPLLVGGTMLYFKALQQGLSDLPEADAVIRADIEEKASRLGWPALHETLRQLDPITAERLKPTDAQRIQRALEVCHLSGEPMSALLGRHNVTPLPYRVISMALLPGDRAVLHQRITQRFDSMLAQGLIDEVKWLKTHYDLTPNTPSMRCVGYRQMWQHLDGEFDYATQREKGIIATRQLAKRQLTWLRSMEELKAFDCLSGQLPHEVLRYLQHAL